jgi:hypothetical protein
MNRWWRAYSDARHDPKLMLLAPDMFRAWFILLCLAAENDGQIKSASDAAFALRVNDAKAKGIIAFLAGKGLFDPVDGGYFMPHNWRARQYLSDVSTDRVKRFRNRQRNNGETFHETTSKRPQITETETEKIEKTSSSRRRKSKAALPSDFRLSEQDIEFALSKGWTQAYLQSEFSRFCDHATAHARQQADWRAAWRNWVTSPFQRPVSEVRISNVKPPRKTMLDCFDDIAADLAAKRHA